MVAAYGPYSGALEIRLGALTRSASATGGNGFARDVLAGIAAFYSTPMYENMGPPRNLNWASTFLGLVAVLVALPAYWCGNRAPHPADRRIGYTGRVRKSDRSRSSRSRSPTSARAAVRVDLAAPR